MHRIESKQGSWQKVYTKSKIIKFFLGIDPRNDIDEQGRIIRLQLRRQLDKIIQNAIKIQSKENQNKNEIVYQNMNKGCY